uniref:hypothetical protein n=1 Tax=Streptomyces scabiei TaxID=1930 RepID=UPI0038F780B9
LYVLQAGLGVANVLLWLPLWLALLHTAGAVLLCLGLGWAWWRYRYMAERSYAERALDGQPSYAQAR